VYRMVRKDASIGEDMGTSIVMPKYPSTWRGLEKIALAEKTLENMLTDAAETKEEDERGERMKEAVNVQQAFYMAAIGPDRMNEYIAFKEQCKLITGAELRANPDKAIKELEAFATDNKLDAINICLTQFADIVSDKDAKFNAKDYDILVQLCETVDRDFVAAKVAEITKKLGSATLNKFFQDGRLNKLIAQMINNHKN